MYSGIAIDVSSLLRRVLQYLASERCGALNIDPASIFVLASPAALLGSVRKGSLCMQLSNPEASNIASNPAT